MIVTDLKHIDRQVSMTPAMRRAIDFLRRPDIHQLADGRVEIDGDRVFAVVQRYETLATGGPKFEYHRKYMDVQCVVSGQEIIGWAPVELMTAAGAYDADKDICFGTVAAEKWTPVKLREGQVAVLWPEDGHAPRLAAGAASPVMKIVVKVAV
jgi:biofilm protein TabA